MSPPISRDGWVNVAGGAVEERRWPCFSSVRSTGVLPYIIFSAVIFLALAASTLFRLIEPVKGWWFPLAPISFIVLSTLVALLILMHDPVPAVIGVVIVLCGIPFRKFLLPRHAATSVVQPHNG